MEYRHSQTSYIVYAIILLVSVGAGLVLSSSGDSSGAGVVMLAVAAILLPVFVVFARLNVVVNDTAVVAAFGWGWPRRQIDLADVVSVRQVRNRWYEGWGIHKVRGGWMYNVGGFDSVELELRSGKVLRIGTDEPEALCSALSQGIANLRL